MSNKVNDIINKAIDADEITDLAISICNYKNDNSLLDFETHLDKRCKYFDLASLTKILVTYKLCQNLDESLNADIIKYLPNFANRQLFEGLSINDLLTHTSGLKAWKNFWINQLDEYSELSLKDKHLRIVKVLDRYKKQELFKADRSYLYSDLNYILLGLILERIYDKEIKELLVDKNIFYKDQSIDKSEFVNYGYCPIRKQNIQAIVHDENSYSLGGLTGHAGAFASFEGIKSYLKEFCLEFEHKLLVAQENPNQKFAFQFQDTKPLIFNRISVGHLGFVGNDFWVDPKSGYFFILLSNRVAKKRRSSFMKEFRRDLYRAIAEELL